MKPSKNMEEYEESEVVAAKARAAMMLTRQRIAGDRYSLIRSQIETGDVFMVEGRSIVGVFIRMVTAQQVNHIAVLINKGEGGIWVAEFVGKGGYKLTPASSWIKSRSDKKQFLYYGKAPESVRAKPQEQIDFINSFRPENGNTKYSYWTLFKVWLSQVTRRKTQGKWVCSVFGQMVWEATGYKGFERLADPGDFMQQCEEIKPLGVM